MGDNPLGENSPNLVTFLAYFCNFPKTAQSKTITQWAKILPIWSHFWPTFAIFPKLPKVKQSRNGQKFSQSGHIFGLLLQFYNNRPK
jgi:hypothetical protein